MGHGAAALIEWFNDDPLMTTLLVVVALSAIVAPLPGLHADVDQIALKNLTFGDRLSLRLADNLLPITVVLLGIFLFNRLIEIVSLGRSAFIIFIILFGVVIVVQRYLSVFIRNAVARRNRLS